MGRRQSIRAKGTAGAMRIWFVLDRARGDEVPIRQTFPAKFELTARAYTS